MKYPEGIEMNGLNTVTSELQVKEAIKRAMFRNGAGDEATNRICRKT